ncbi:MAG: ADP compounds hydrolase NudE [Phototrophicales bacterium]|nr:MAG: ADP compounds hydrolase NudE [Phototrophicales bacterium]RMG69857.1 MAG: NUDIX domain-containing protein [Chloroflexota bacterium]
MEKHYYQDSYFQLVGDESRAYFLRTHNGVLCVPLTDSGLVIFIVEPSPAMGVDILTLPGGGINPQEDLQTAANRELQEEIGYFANQLDYLGVVRPWIKYLDSAVHLYLARHLMPSKLHGDELHEIRTQLVPLADFQRLIERGELMDATTISALFLARQFLLTT